MATHPSGPPSAALYSGRGNAAAYGVPSAGPKLPSGSVAWPSSHRRKKFCSGPPLTAGTQNPSHCQLGQKFFDRSGTTSR